MSRNISKKYIWMICVLVAFLFVVNQWLMKQLKDVEEKTLKEPEVVAPAVIEPPVDTRMGIPKIDPNNDPLAPVVKQKKPVVSSSAEPVAAQTEEKKVYEFPLSSPILAQ